MIRLTRTNNRFRNRIKSQAALDMKDRMLFLEHTNHILVKNALAQSNVNKELRGKYTNVAKRLSRLSDHMTTLTSAAMDEDSDNANNHALAELADQVNALSANVDIMADLLEDIS